MGFLIGMIVADTHQRAINAAKLVHVEYKELPHVLTIEVIFLFTISGSDNENLESNRNRFLLGPPPRNQSWFIRGGLCCLGSYNYWEHESRGTGALLP